MTTPWGRVDFNPVDFNNMIQDHGYNLQWSKAVTCPCIDPATDRAVSDCYQCDGRGRYYYDTQVIKGLITRTSKELNLENVLGVLNPGEAFLTVPHSYYLGMFDKVVNVDSTVIFSEVVIHNDADGDSLTYPPVGMPRLINGILTAVTQTDKHAPVVNLIPGKDFDIDADGTIKWLTTSVPKQDQGISFRYFYNPVWLVIEMPNYLRDTFVEFGHTVDTFENMPVRAIIRLEMFGQSAKK